MIPFPDPPPPRGLAISARSAEAVARRIYREPIARVVIDALKFMQDCRWLGDEQRLRDLVAAVHADAGERGAA